MKTISKTVLSRFLVSALLGMAVLSGAAPAQAKPVRPHDVIRVNGEELGTVVFAQLIFNDDDEEEILGLKDKHVEMLNDRMRAVGYRVPAYTASVFKESELPDSDFVLAGTLTEIECIERFDVTCGLTVEWELLHAVTDEVVYKVTARHEESKLMKMKDAERADALLGGTLDALLARQRFVDAVAGREGSASRAVDYPELVIKRCKGSPPPMPKGSEKALRATAVVRARGGTGSAVFISPDGYLLTAAHVATDDELDVLFMNGKEARAEVIRIDEARDVALLRLKDHGVTTECLQLSEDTPAAGEDIYAIGSPGGENLSFSISRGIVSGRRTIEGTSFLQTDASINAGNSGGPLLGSDARVRAIASWKVAGEQVEGLGFGVPSSTAMNTLKFRFGDESDTAAPIVRRKVSTASVVVDDPDPRWFYVGEDAPGKIPGWVGPVRGWGWGALGTGSGILALAYLSANDSAVSTDASRNWKIAGWTTAGIGLGMVLSSYFLGKSKKPPESEVAANDGPRLTPIIGWGFGGFRVTY